VSHGTELGPCYEPDALVLFGANTKDKHISSNAAKSLAAVPASATLLDNTVC